MWKSEHRLGGGDRCGQESPQVGGGRRRYARFEREVLRTVDRLPNGRHRLRTSPPASTVHDLLNWRHGTLKRMVQGVRP